MDNQLFRTADPRVEISHEDGLDFIVERTGSAADPSFPSISHIIRIEKIIAMSSLVIQSMVLIMTPSPTPWCGAFVILFKDLTGSLQLYCISDGRTGGGPTTQATEGPRVFSTITPGYLSRNLED
jgi:hypothetical protein